MPCHIMQVSARKNMVPYEFTKPLNHLELQPSYYLLGKIYIDLRR